MPDKTYPRPLGYEPFPDRRRTQSATNNPS